MTGPPFDGTKLNAGGFIWNASGAGLSNTNVYTTGTVLLGVFEAGKTVALVISVG